MCQKWYKVGFLWKIKVTIENFLKFESLYPHQVNFMSYKETLNSGLKRGFEVVLETDDLNKNINVKVEEVKKTIKIDGFRPGKVPTNIIMQKHGDAINAEVLNKMVNDNVSQIIQENKYRPVSQPKVDLKDSSKILWTTNVFNSKN